MKKQLSTRRIIAFCTGDFARAILDGLLVTYALKFFNVTESSGLPLLLPIGLMGVLRGVGVFYDALTDPIVASLSDRHKGKNGRRVPFIRWAAVPYALCTLLVFFPPNGTVTTLNIVWVVIMLILHYTFSTLFNVPYLALQAEIVPDTRRRVFFYTISSTMFVLGSSVIYVLPVIESSLSASGMAPVTAWRIAFGIFAAIGAVCAVIPGFCLKEADYVERSKSSYSPLLQSFKTTFAYKNFSIMTAGYIVKQTASTFFNAALLFYVDILLGLKSSFSTIVLGLSIVVGLCTYPFINKMAKKVGKKFLIIISCINYLVVYMGIFFGDSIAALISTKPVSAGILVSLAGASATNGQVTVAFLIGILIAFPIAVNNIIIPATFSDMIQYDTLKTGENRAGMFIAARQFGRKVAASVSTALVSYVMYYGTTNEYPTVLGVRLTALAASIFIVVSTIIFAFYNDKEVVDYIHSHTAKAE